MMDIMHLELVPFGFGKIIRPLTHDELAADPNTTINLLNQTSKLLPILDQFAQPWNPTPDLKILCQHGESECAGNAWEACIQDVAPNNEVNFPILHCIESRSCAEGIKPPDCVAAPADVVQGCVLEHSQGKVNTQALIKCFNGERARELLVLNDVATLDANIQWAPWITLDGTDLIEDPNNENSTIAFREQFLLGKKICDTYAAKTGKEPPAACATFPQSDTDIPEKVYDKYTPEDFTEFIANQKKQAELQEMQRVQFLQEQQAATDKQDLFLYGGIAAVIVLVLAGGYFAWTKFSSKKSEETEGLLEGEQKPA